MLACIGGHLAAADSKLQIKYQDVKATPRMIYATEQVRLACTEVGARGTLRVRLQGAGGRDKLKPEGFRLKGLRNDTVEVVGADQSGVLYGCLELVDRIRAAKAIPAKLDFTDAPEFKLRGPCIGMQNVSILPKGDFGQSPGRYHCQSEWCVYQDRPGAVFAQEVEVWSHGGPPACDYHQ